MMIDNKLISTIVGCILTGSCGHIPSKDIQFKQLVGFETEPAYKANLETPLYQILNEFKEKEGLVFEEMSYLMSLLEIQGDSAKFRFKGVYQNSNVSVTANSLSLNGVRGPLIHHTFKEKVYLIDDVENDNAKIVFNSTPEDFCYISMVIYQNNKATYISTQDSFGIYLGEKDTINECRQNLDNDIKLIDKLPLGVKDKDIRQAENLAHLLNTIKSKHQLTNSQIGKMIAMSNIDIGMKELTYPEPYRTDNLTISHESYQITNDSKNKPVTIEGNSNPKLIIFSTNHKNKTELLGSTELEEFNDLKLIIYKQGSSYLYDINKMKHRTVIQN